MGGCYLHRWRAVAALRLTGSGAARLQGSRNQDTAARGGGCFSARVISTAQRRLSCIRSFSVFFLFHVVAAVVWCRVVRDARPALQCCLGSRRLRRRPRARRVAACCCRLGTSLHTWQGSLLFSLRDALARATPPLLPRSDMQTATRCPSRRLGEKATRAPGEPHRLQAIQPLLSRRLRST